jgi:hypothetical protein
MYVLFHIRTKDFVDVCERILMRAAVNTTAPLLVDEGIGTVRNTFFFVLAYIWVYQS